MDPWRAVDHEGKILDMLVQGRRDRSAALRVIRKLLSLVISKAVNVTKPPSSHLSGG